MTTDNRLPDEKRIQLFFEAADSLTEAAMKEQSAAHNATLALQKLNHQVSAQLRELQHDVSTALSASAEKTATEAAVLLTSHFTAANEAARRAREGYERATRKLNRRVWAGFAAVQLVVILLFAVAVYFLVPSLDEIQNRQTTLARLQEEKAGFPLSWTDCKDKGKVSRCFRVDERAGTVKPGDGSIWYVPWREK